MTERSNPNWTFHTKQEEEAWQELLARLEKSVNLHFAPLERFGFQPCGLEHRRRNEIRDYTVCFRFIKGAFAIDLQMGAIGLYLWVVLLRFPEPIACGRAAQHISAVDLEAGLSTLPNCRLEKPSWLGHTTLRDAAQKLRRNRYVDLVKNNTDDCVKLLADRLLRHGHLLEPALDGCQTRT